MRRLIFAACLAACEGGQRPGEGVIAFAEPQTLDLRVVDVETGTDKLVDRGFHGSLSISPDGLWIAAVSTDRNVRLFGRDGTKRLSLPPGGNECFGTPTWHGDALDWCFEDGEGEARVLLPVATGTPRRIATTNIVFSPDQALVAYTRRNATSAPEHGDLVLENVDGSGQRILATEVVQFPAMFSADGRFLLAVEFSGGTSHVLRFSVEDGSRTMIGDGSVARPLLPQARLGLDGSEILAAAGQDVFAIDIASGARRAIATLEPETFLIGAAFLDREHVLYMTRRIQSTGDVEVIDEILHVVAANSDTVLTSGCHVAGIAPTRGFIAVSCPGGGATVMTFDGLGIFDRAGVEALGFTPDELGIIAVGDDGAIEYLGFEGHTRALGTATTAADAFIMHGLNPPYVSYAP